MTTRRKQVSAWAKNHFGDQVAPNGKPARENFVSWFGESRVADENGDPLVVYHGTNSDFSVFDLSKSGRNHYQGEGAFFFTDKSSSAKNYGAIASGSLDGGAVIPVYLSLKNPLIESRPDYYSAVEHYDDNLSASVLNLQAEGHDGVIVKSPSGSLFVAFEPTQIKSATDNTGTFDPNSACISDIHCRDFERSGDSLVADSQGKPIVLYHGTRGRFTEFTTGRAGGIYFTPRRAHAKGYGPNIMEAHLHVERLADLTDPKSDAYRIAVDEFNAQGGWSSNEDAMDGRDSPDFDPTIDATWEMFDNPDTDVSGALRTAGYDGVKLQEYGNDVSYVVFQSEQIKPATPTALGLTSPDLSETEFEP